MKKDLYVCVLVQEVQVGEWRVGVPMAFSHTFKGRGKSQETGVGGGTDFPSWRFFPYQDDLYSLLLVCL